jgi:lysophospholipase L1-like esterase
MSQSIAYEPATYAIHRLASFDQNIKTPDGNIQATIRRGYRGKAFQAEKPIGEKRIVFIGGSFVYDPHAAKGRDWPHRIERILHTRGFNHFKVINAGIPGHSSADAVGRLYSEIHMFQPDYVVLCNAWNDIKYFHYLSPDKTLLKNTTGLIKASHLKISLPVKLLEESQLVIRVKALIRRINHDNIGFEGNLPEGELLDHFDEWGLKQYRLNLATFIDICRNIGAEPILLTQPRLVARDNSDEEKERIKYQYVLLNHDALRRAFNACDSEMRDIARKKDAILFDISDLMNGRHRYFKTHVHFSNLGSQKFAEAIVELLLKNGLISS